MVAIIIYVVVKEVDLPGSGDEDPPPDPSA